MAEERGWLQKQMESDEKEVNAWPDWLKRAVGIKGLHNLDLVCGDFMKQCEAFAEKLVEEIGISSENADQVKNEIVGHFSKSVTVIKHAVLRKKDVPK